MRICRNSNLIHHTPLRCGESPLLPMKLARLLRFAFLSTAFLLTLTQFSQTGEAAPRELKALLEETSYVSEEVSLLNLINGLNLDSAQLKKLAEFSKKANDARSRAVEKAGPLSDRFVLAMEKLRASLLVESNQAESLGNEAAALKHQLKEIADGCGVEIARLEKEAAKVFTDSQHLVMENFVPCIVPPKSFKDPVRVGQAASSAGKERILRKVRQMPERQYLNRRDKVITNFIAKSEKRLGSLTPEEKETLRKKAIDLVDRVRSMEDADFLADLDALAGELRPPQAKEIDDLDEMRKRVNARKPQPGSVARWFFSPQAPQILEAKARRLDTFK